MKIALLADLHLPDSERTVKEEVLDWLFRPRSGLGADRIGRAPGDLTGHRNGFAPPDGCGRRLESTGHPRSC